MLRYILIYIAIAFHAHHTPSSASSLSSVFLQMPDVLYSTLGQLGQCLCEPFLFPLVSLLVNFTTVLHNFQSTSPGSTIKILAKLDKCSLFTPPEFLFLPRLMLTVIFFNSIPSCFIPYLYLYLIVMFFKYMFNVLCAMVMVRFP